MGLLVRWPVDSLALGDSLSIGLGALDGPGGMMTAENALSQGRALGRSRPRG